MSSEGELFCCRLLLLAHLKADTGDRVQCIGEVEQGSVESQRLPDRDRGKLVARSDQMGANPGERGVLADEGFVDCPDPIVSKRIHQTRECW